MKKLLLFISVAALAALLAFAFAACGADEPGLKIGDTGPGGGTVFFAKDGTYKECSWEIDRDANWFRANSAIASFNASGEFSDWYLPDIGELSLMYENLHRRGLGRFTVGVGQTEHWSSTWSGTIGGSDQYRVLDFLSGGMKTQSSYGVGRTRAVRSFTLESDAPGIVGNAILTIKNESGFELADVLWNNVSFANPGENSIKPGTSVAMNVPDGSGFIRFNPKANPAALRSQELVVVGKDEQKEFVFLNNTLVANESGGSGTLSSFSGVPVITVRQGSTVIVQHGEHDFGNVMPGVTRDITFTIENSGGVNLIIESVDGRRINLDDNLSGRFSITQQPLGATIAPGSSATFTIRFAPTVRGSAFSAAVHVKTSCHANAEFAFRVIGSSIIYTIGDTGPGGGTVFFASGGQYKEYSAELGNLSWSAAGTAARAHRGGGFTDWRLPDNGEALQVVAHIGRAVAGTFLYWSSSSAPSFSYWAVGFDSTTGTNPPVSSGISSSVLLRTRAVRVFTIQ
jgi:hypothetical protein